ncbi:MULTISPECIES: ketoacyl-ACP synthase III [unclassified Sutcliffiella]|uniref:ketoacyl-ACP synthase III n=1 Tax=unclassified Sutcliffiella TaxID=2837532 RepID=UPI0030CBF35B
MIYIQEIGSYIPDNYISNYQRKGMFNIDNHFIEQSIGIKQVSRKLKDEDTSDMCLKAFENLLRKTKIKVEDIDCIVVCTQNPDKEGLPNTASILHKKMGAVEECASFDISIGCSGYIYGLSIVKSFIESNNMKNGLLFTCDPYSKIINDIDKNTTLLFGDAATVTLLINTNHMNTNTSKSGFSPIRFIFSTQGEKYSLNKVNGFINMNGRAVYNFSAKKVPVQVRKLLDVEKMDAEKIDLFIFHQGSKFIVETLRKRLELPRDKVPIYLENQGNTISSSIPLILESKLNNNELEYVILSGFGIGLSWASCLLMRKFE